MPEGTSDQYGVTSVDRRRLLKALGAGASVTVAGCGGDGDAGDGGSSGDGDGSNDSDGGGGGDKGDILGEGRIGYADAENSISYWTLDGFTHNPETNQELGEVHAEFFRSWAEEHTDWKIDIAVQTDLEQMKTKLLQTVAQDQGPEMSEVDSFWVPNFYGDLQPVDEAIDDPDDWYPFVEEVAKNDGSWRAVWQNTDCRALYWRQDMMDQYNDGEPPETWDEVIEVGQAIVENEDMNGYMYNGGRWEATTFDNLAHFWALGGNLVDDGGAPVLDQDENRQALLDTFNWFKRTIDSGVTPERVANIDDYELLREAALNDETAMFLGGNWQINNIKSEVDSEEEWQNWKVSKIPQKSADIAATGTGGWTKAVLTDDDDKRQAATDLYKQFITKDNMAERCQVGGFLPTRPSVFEEVDYFAEDPYFQVYSDLLENGRARPGYPIYVTISEEWQIAAGKVLSGQASPEDAAQTMIDNVNSDYEG